MFVAFSCPICFEVIMINRDIQTFYAQCAVHTEYFQALIKFPDEIIYSTANNWSTQFSYYSPNNAWIGNGGVSVIIITLVDASIACIAKHNYPRINTTIVIRINQILNHSAWCARSVIEVSMKLEFELHNFYFERWDVNGPQSTFNFAAIKESLYVFHWMETHSMMKWNVCCVKKMFSPK